MNSTITHRLDRAGQARYGREMAVKGWTRRPLTSYYMGWDKHDTHETAVKAWNRRSLTGSSG
jgi:hypothetical protein